MAKIPRDDLLMRLASGETQRALLQPGVEIPESSLRIVDVNVRTKDGCKRLTAQVHYTCCGRSKVLMLTSVMSFIRYGSRVCILCTRKRKRKQKRKQKRKPRSIRENKEMQLMKWAHKLMPRASRLPKGRLLTGERRGGTIGK